MKLPSYEYMHCIYILIIFAGLFNFLYFDSQYRFITGEWVFASIFLAAGLLVLTYVSFKLTERRLSNEVDK